MPTIVIEQEERDLATEESNEVFDRVKFAMTALALVCPPKMTVAVCHGRSRLRVESGRSWGRGEGERWAMVSIPPRASREAIVLALTELRAPSDGESAPYVLDVLLSRMALPGEGAGDRAGEKR